MRNDVEQKQITISKSLHCHSRPLESFFFFLVIHCTPPQIHFPPPCFIGQPSRDTEHSPTTSFRVFRYKRRRSNSSTDRNLRNRRGGGRATEATVPRSRATHEDQHGVHSAQCASTDDSFGSVHARLEACCRSTDSARQPSPTTEIRIGEERPSQSNAAGGGANGIFAVPLSFSIGRNREAVDNEPSCVHRSPLHRTSRAPLPRFKFSVLVRLGRSPSRVLLVSPFFPGTRNRHANFFWGPVVTGVYFCKHFWLVGMRLSFFFLSPFFLRLKKFGVESF